MTSKRMQHSLEFKRTVLDYLFEDEQNPKTAYAAEKRFKADGHKVNKQSIHGWIQKRLEIMSESQSNKRLPGETLLSPENEDLLIGIIKEEREEGNRVTGSQVEEWALAIAEENDEVFKASDGWLDSFLTRNHFSFRRVTNLKTLTSEELVGRAVKFMSFLKESRESGWDPQKVVLMDEIAVYLEDPRRITINESGYMHVTLKSTGFASMRVTAILPITVSGQKLRPFIIQKKSGETGRRIEQKHGCFIAFNERAWVNQELIKEWIDLAFPQVDLGAGKGIVWDSCRPHLAKTVKEHLVRRGIKQAVIPGGLTAYLQAGDLGVFKSFKDKIGVLIDQLKSSGQVKYTKAKNPKPPEIGTVCDWVKTAWIQVDDSVISNSIRAAGLALKTTGLFLRMTFTVIHFETLGKIEDSLT